MTALLRILGIEAMAHLGRRLPPGWSRLISAVALVLANLMPIWAVLEGRLGMGDVLLIYWFENVVVWATTTIKILTTTAPGDTRVTGFKPRTRPKPPWMTGDPQVATFFAIHYGIFTFVHGVFAVVFAVLAGLHGSVLDAVATVGAILLSHVLSLGLNWFGRGERNAVTPGLAMVAPYPRMLALHLTVILGFFFLGGPDGRTANDLGAVALLMGAKTVLDLAFHAVERTMFRRRAQRLAGSPNGRRETGRGA